MTKTVLVVLASILGLGLVSLGQQERGTDTGVTTVQEQEPEGGWLMSPQEFHLGRSWGSAGERGVIVTGYSVVDAEGLLRIFMVQSGAGALDSPFYRLVVTDREGGRHPLKWDHAGGLSNRDTVVKNAIFTLDPKILAADKIARIAIERVKPGKRQETRKD